MARHESIILNEIVGNVTFKNNLTVDGNLVSDGTTTFDNTTINANAVSTPTGTSLKVAGLVHYAETVLASGLTDGGGAVGTKTLTHTIPAGAVFVRSTLSAITGFAGDVSAVITLGDGTDVDRYNTGTPSVFTTAAQGVDAGVPSGTLWHTAAIATIVATVTSDANITAVLTGGGSVKVDIWYYVPA